MVNMKALVHQAVLLNCTQAFPSIQYFFAICGYGAGKTSSLVMRVNKDIKDYSGKTDSAGGPPAFILAGISLTFLEKNTLGDLKKSWDASATKYTHDKKNNIVHIGGIQIFLVSLTDYKNIFGLNACAVYIDELDELPSYSVIPAVYAVTERARQHIRGMREPFIMSVTTSQGLKGTYMLIEYFKERGTNYLIVRGETKNNPHLPKSYVNTIYSIYKDKERAVYLEGRFMNIASGLVFPHYEPVRNTVKGIKIKPDEQIIIGQDFNTGFNHAKAGVVRDGKIVIVKEYNFPSMNNAPITFRYDFPLNPITWIPDSTANDIILGVRKVFASQNIAIYKWTKNPLVRDRVFLMNSLFESEALFVSDECPDLQKALISHQKDPKTGSPMKGQGEDAPDHQTDALGYLCYYLLLFNKAFYDYYIVTIGRRKGIQADPKQISHSNKESIYENA